MDKSVINLFKRLCKEENVFTHKDIVGAYMNRMKKFNTCVFFGLVDLGRMYTDKEQMSFYKIQLDLASMLMNKGALNWEDRAKLISDTLERYNINPYFFNIDDLWVKVVKYSKKEEFRDKIKKYVPHN